MRLQAPLGTAVYASTCLAMAIGPVFAGPQGHKATMAIAAALGFITWPFIEYVLHRFVLHGIRPFSTWHAAHHQDSGPPHPTPTLSILSLMLALVLLPAAMLAGPWHGLAFTSGVMMGYGVYMVTHHAIHHCRCRHTWLRQRKFRHALHHDRLRPPGYYGVTTSLWDQILGTAHRHDF